VMRVYGLTLALVKFDSWKSGVVVMDWRVLLAEVLDTFY